MRIPRFTIKGLMIAVAVLAVDFFLIVEVFAGVILPILILNLGLILILRPDGWKRRFWVGYVVTGGLILAIYAGISLNNDELLTDWANTVFVFLFEHAPPAWQGLINRVMPNGDNLIGVYVLFTGLFEATFGLPQVLLAAVGGCVWRWVGPKKVVGPALVENPVGLLVVNGPLNHQIVE